VEFLLEAVLPCDRENKLLLLFRDEDEEECFRWPVVVINNASTSVVLLFAVVLRLRLLLEAPRAG
jgi:hypothetical protein